MQLTYKKLFTDENEVEYCHSSGAICKKVLTKLASTLVNKALTMPSVEVVLTDNGSKKESLACG